MLLFTQTLDFKKRRLVTASSRGEAKLWNFNNGYPLSRYKQQDRGEIYDI